MRFSGANTQCAARIELIFDPRRCTDKRIRQQSSTSERGNRGSARSRATDCRAYRYSNSHPDSHCHSRPRAAGPVDGRNMLRQSGLVFRF